MTDLNSKLIGSSAELILTAPALHADPDIKSRLTDYVKLGKIACVGHSSALNRGDPTQRMSDQVVRGFPLTCEEFPWPKSDDGAPMQPMIQLNLENAGKLLSQNLGKGLLQVWAKPDLSSNVLRIIGTDNFSCKMDDFYPEGAPWDDEDDFHDCIFPAELNTNPVIEWLDSTVMYPATGRACCDLSSSRCDEFDAVLIDLDIKVSRDRLDLIQLGGYPWSGDNAAGHVGYDGTGRNVLVLLADGQGMFTLMVTFEIKLNEQPIFKVFINYM